MGGLGSRPREPSVDEGAGEGDEPPATFSTPRSSPSHSQNPPPAPTAPVPPGLHGRHFVLAAVDAERAQASGGCSICTLELLENEAVLELDCQHLFHASCLSEWLAKQPTCPLCRFEALDISTVVSRLVAEIQSVPEQGRHHHDYLPLLEQLISLARDKRFVETCAGSCSCLASLARAHACPTVRAMVLELFLTFSQKGELHSLIWEAQEDLLALLSETLRNERAPLRAASCGLIWNLAAAGSGAAAMRASLGCFLGTLVGLVEDEDALVSQRATRALGFLAQSPDLARCLLQGELAEALLRRASSLDPSGDELGYLLQTLSHCIEFVERSGAGGEAQEELGEEEGALLYDGLFPQLSGWLQGGNESVRVQACQVALLLSRFRRQEHMSAWFSLYEQDGALGRFLRGRRPADEAAFAECRAQAIGTVWNLAMNEEWRRPLAKLVLPGLLEVAAEDEGQDIALQHRLLGPEAVAEVPVSSAGGADNDALDGVTRERLVTALWHLSKDEAVAADRRWLEAAPHVAGLVKGLPGEVQIHGLQLLEHLGHAHEDAVAEAVIPVVWQLAGAEGRPVAKEAMGVFCLILLFSRMPAGRDWLWRCEAFPYAIKGMLERLQGAGSDGPTASGAAHAKAQLVGALWNLAMDDGPGRREALGQIALPLMPGLFRDGSTLIMARACTAAFHLVGQAPKNTELLRRALAPDFDELLGEMLRRLSREELQLHLHHLLTTTQALLSFGCGRCAGEDCPSLKRRLGLQLVESFHSLGFLESRISADGCVAEAESESQANMDCEHQSTNARLVCMALFLLVILTSSCMECSDLCGELVARGFFEEGSAIWRLLAPTAASMGTVEARMHALGTLQNVAAADGGGLRREVASRCLGRLLEMLRSAEREPHRLDEQLAAQLMMVLIELAKDAAVRARREWLGAVQAVIKLAGTPGMKECTSPVDLLGLLVEAHGVEVARQAAPLLWDRVTAEDAAEQYNAPTVFAFFIHVSDVLSASAWLTPFEEVGEKLAGTWRRLRASSAPGAKDALANLAGALWNLAMDKTPEWRETLGRWLLPVMVGEGQWWAPVKDGNPVLVLRIATCLHHLSCAGANAELLAPAAWSALEAGELPDDCCARVLQVLANVLQELGRRHGNAGAVAVSSGERAMNLLSCRRWTARRSPRGSWPESSVAEMTVLMQVSTMGGPVRERLAGSALLTPGGVVHEALQPRPCRPEAWEREVRSRAFSVALNLANSESGALRTWLAGILLKSLLAASKESLEDLAVGDCEKLLAALSLCAEAAPEASLWAPSKGPIVRLVERVEEQRGDRQATACGRSLLETVFP